MNYITNTRLEITNTHLIINKRLNTNKTKDAKIKTALFDNQEIFSLDFLILKILLNLLLISVPPRGKLATLGFTTKCILESSNSIYFV
jgi:hypothetical protein